MGARGRASDASRKSHLMTDELLSYSGVGKEFAGRTTSSAIRQTNTCAWLASPTSTLPSAASVS